jgi:glycosyltransferase involved in cell wall biosynthesis
LRIFYISHSTIPSRFANSVHVMKMCQALARIGHDVTLFVKEGLSHGLDDFFYYGVSKSFKLVKISLPTLKWVKPLSYLFKLRGIVRSGPVPDLFYTRYVYALLIISDLRQPVIFEAHSLPQNWLERMILRNFMKRENCAALVLISEGLLREYRKIFADPPQQKIIVAHDGADVQPVAVSQSNPVSLRFGRFNVAYVGGLYNGRGIENILEMAKALGDCDFHIIGGSPAEVNLFKNREGLAGNVFFYGYLDPFKLPAFYKDMDVLLAPYQRKVAVGHNRDDTAGWMSPLKIFEYMAAGKAIVASDLPAIREILTHNETALLVDPEDINAWVQAIVQLRDHSLRERLGLRTKEVLIAKYTWLERAKHCVGQVQL